MIGIWWLIVMLIGVIPLIIGLLVMGAQRRVLVKHEQSGLLKSGYVGYCWTYWLFGWMVPIVRGEIGIGVLHLVLTLVSLGLFQLFMPFLYNQQFMTRLLTGGWTLHDSAGKNQWARLKLGITEQ